MYNISRIKDKTRRKKDPLKLKRKKLYRQEVKIASPATEDFRDAYSSHI